MPSRLRVQSAPDPFVMGEHTRLDNSFNNCGNRDINTKTVRANGLTINSAIRNLVLISAGQSNFMSVGTSAYAPVNSSVVDNFNPYNGQMYAAADPLLGTGLAIQSGTFGPGSVSTRLADLLVTNGKFDRVIIAPVAIGGTSADMWGTGGELVSRIPSTMARLASRGIIPGMTGVTFAFVWGQGESDNSGGTSQAAYTASLSQVLTALYATGFNGRSFINLQTWISGASSATIRAAQSSGSIITGSVFQGADADALTGANRQADNTHFSDAGLANLASAMYTAMHASGSPF